MFQIYKRKYFTMLKEQVLNLSAFGDVIENPKKRIQEDDEPKGFIFGGGKKIRNPFNDEDPTEIERIPLQVVSKDDATMTLGNVSDESPKMNQEGPVVQINSEDKTSNVNLMVSIVLRSMIQIKLLHWQTYSDPQHRALDDLFDTLVEKGDELVESTMGKYGRPVLDDSTKTLVLDNYSDSEGLLKHIKDLDGCFRGQITGVLSEKEDPELLNIVHEILGKIGKIKHLLTLNKL